jgi:hypothetical protein
MTSTHNDTIIIGVGRRTSPLVPLLKGEGNDKPPFSQGLVVIDL